MNFQYRRNYFPPAPVIDIILISSAESLRSDPLPALIDSGADGTIVPIDYLDEIHAPLTEEMVIRSQWGERHSVMLYLVDVQIGDLTVPGIEVVGDEISDEVIIPTSPRPFSTGPDSSFDIVRDFLGWHFPKF